MGRADLATHRSSSPSDTKPIAFPKRAAWVLHHILHVPNVNIASTFSTIRDASTQKAQVSALKLLGIQIRDAHTEGNSSGQTLCPCIADGEQRSTEARFCRMAGSVITGVLFESPDATAGLVSTSLRAVLKSPVPLEEVNQAFSQFFERLENAAMSSPPPESTLPFSASIADMRFISVIVAEPQTRGWVFDYEKRVRGSLNAVNEVVQIYLQVTLRDEMQTMHLFSNSEQNASPLSERVQSAGENKRLLENASDFALKAAQDLLNGLQKSSLEHPDVRFPPEMVPIVRKLVGSCKELLSLSTVPRNCALACSVAYITGLLIVDGAEYNAEKISRVLKSKVFVELPQFPPFSRLSLLRAIMEAPAARESHPLVLFPPGDQIWSTKDKFTVFERLILMVRDNGDAHLRYLATDALVKCIRRRRPVKLGFQCRKAAILVIKGRWHETFPGTTLQVKEAIEALIAVDGNDPESTTFWEEMAFTLVSGSWYHRGIYAPLNILITRIGAMRLLQCEPRCQDKAIEAACTDSRLTKPAADWLGSFWNALRSECQNSGTSFADLTCNSLLLPLTDASRKSLREITAEQILPVYFQRLDKRLVEVYAKSLLERLDQLEVDSARQAGAVVTIMSAARNRGVFVGSFAEPEVLRFLRDSLMSADDEMRSTTFELIVTSRAPTEPIRQEELDLVLMYLPLALTYCSSLSHRSRFRHSMRRFFERLAACRKAASDGCGGWWTRERKTKYGGVRTASFENMREMLVDRLLRFETACFKILLANVYPGAAFGRRMNAFELMILMSENLGLHRFLSSRSYGGVLGGITVGLLDEWERTRRSALRVLLSLPDLPPGLQTLSEAAALQEASIPLLQSPRLRDVDSGASIIRFVYKKLVLPVAISKKKPSSSSEVKYFSFPRGLVPKPELSFDVPSLYYAKTILISLEEVLSNSTANFSEACVSGLFHSRFRILRQVLRDHTWKEFVSTSDMKSASSLISQVIDLAWSCTHVALKGVSFEALTTFSGLPAGDDLLEDEHIFLHDRKQLEMTTSFLSLKEICITLGILIHEVSLEGLSSTLGEPALIGVKDVKRIGDLFLHVFSNTRHWGVIDGAAEGFQLLCERLLLATNSALRSLPNVWSSKMINEALGGNMYVLRRSAGLPALVNAVVSSEANSDSRSLHAPLLEGIVTFLLKHLEQSHMLVDPAMVASERSKEEEGVSHALNMLRSLFLNTKIAKRILKYFEKTVIVCVEAFCSASWLIRNSAMMLFSALVRRGIGVCGKNESDSPLSSFSARPGTSATLLGTRRTQGVTPVQFFSRYPKLHPFLKSQLQLSLKHADKGKDADYPSLFPTLYLLSSLNPGAPEDPATNVSMKPFREVLRKCSHWHSDYIRRVAASASVLLVEDHFSTAEFLKDLIVSAIPIDPIVPETDAEEYVSDGDGRDGRSDGDSECIQVLRQNHLHGDLLTVEAILQGTVGVLDAQHVKDIVHMFAQYIPERLWVASDRNPCNYTRATMVRVMTIVYRMVCDLMEDAKVSESLRFCKSIINICHKLDDTLRGEGPCSKPKESLIGSAALRIASSGLSRLRITRTVQRAEENPHIPSLRMALIDIETDDSELKLNGFENSRFVLKNHFVNAVGRRKEKSMSAEARELLTSIWTHAKHCCKTTEDEELLISALKLQFALFDFSREHWTSNFSGRLTWSEEELVRIIEQSRYHPCIEVREEALILLGKAVSLNPSWVSLSSAWMKGLETAASSSNSSSRLAVCTSLTASKMGCSQTCADLSQSLGARGYLLWTKLLQDEHADVVSHALQKVQAYLWGQQYVTKSVLPTLTEIFKRLAEQHKKSPALFHFSELLLGGTSTDQRKHNLFQFLRTLTGQHTEHKEIFEFQEETVAYAERTENTRLFELEEGSFHGERILEMQLVARCFSNILSSLHCDNQHLGEEAEDLIWDLSNKLKSSLECASKSTSTGIFGSKSFSSPGFETCYASIIRTYLGIRCIQTVSRNKHSIVLENITVELRADFLQWKHSLHPVLAMAVNGLCAMVDGKRGPWEAEATTQILFLL